MFTDRQELREYVWNNLDITEKWKGDAKIKKTGEHANKSVEQIDAEIASLKEKQKAITKSTGKADPDITDQLRELYFAKRSKQGWPKGEGSVEVGK